MALPIVAPRDYTEITELTADDSRIEIYDSDTDSNYYIKYKTLYNNLTSKQTITLSGAITLTNVINRIELDCSLGNISVSLPTPDFEGQTLEFFTTGSGIADITGTGLYVNKVFQTSNTGILRVTAISATDWKADNGVTADYVSGALIIKQSSSGNLSYTGTGGATFTATATALQIVVLPVNFIASTYDVGTMLVSLVSGSGSIAIPIYATPLVNQVTLFYAEQNQVATSGNISTTYGFTGGKY